MRFGELKVSNKYALPTADGNANDVIRTDGSGACSFNSVAGSSPAGAIVIWGSTSIPSGWLKCDGSVVSQATYAALYALITTTYGSDAGGNFTLPDCRGRVPAMLSTDTEFDVMGETGGENTHTLTEAELAAHTHAGYNPPSGTVCTTGTSAYASAGNTESTGGGGAHNNLQPYITINYIIKT